MKRDMDIIRKIVVASMEIDDPLKAIDGVDNETFGFHAMLLEEAGLAKCFIHESSDSASPTVDLAIVWRLTWDGFEFAQSIRDPDIWEKAKTNIINPAASWSFGLLLEVVKYEAKKKLGIMLDGSP